MMDKQISLSRRIGIDLDGTIRNIYDPLVNEIQRIYPRVIIKPIIEWNNYNIWQYFNFPGGISDSPIKTRETILKKIWFDSPSTDFILNTGAFTYPYTISTLHRLQKMGHKIIIVSAQHNKQCIKATIDWLNDQIPYDELHFTDYLTKPLVDCDVFLEDSPFQYKYLTSKGYRCYLMDRPWNKDVKTEFRVKDMLKFEEKIKEHFQ